MSPSSQQKPKGERPSIVARIGQALRRYFVTGLATLVPVFVTVWLLLWIFNFADARLGRLFGTQVPGLGLVATFLVILFVGILSIHFFGRFIFRTIEVWFSWLPVVRRVYPAVKQLAQFLFNSDENQQAAFRRVVLVQYPRLGSYSVSFVTNEAETSVIGGKPKRVLTLLIPQPPSPVTGPIIIVPEEDVIPLDLTVEQAVKLIMSGGVVASPLRTPSSTSK